MGLVFRKTRKIRKSWKSRKQSQHIHQLQSNHRELQRGGAARMIIKYISKRGNTSENIKLISGEMNIDMDMTEKYNLGQLDKEPRVELQGLGPGKQYLLTMTDPNALGKTWSHWVAEINSAGQVSKPVIENMHHLIHLREVVCIITYFDYMILIHLQEFLAL